MKEYYEAVNSGDKKGAILMGVCRGRSSEGLDFKDEAGRCVLVVGIPFALISEPKIILKQHYLDSNNKINLSG